MDIKKEYERWLENATADANVAAELKTLDNAKIEDHNTVCINGRDQSEMLGAFLWGKRAESQLISHSNAQGKIELTASHDGYSPAKHIRKYEFDGESVYNEIQLNPCEINTETISEYILILRLIRCYHKGKRKR